MSKHLLKIDVSNSRYETYDDSIKVQITNEEEVLIKFSKLVSQSSYVLENYKYSEALYSIPYEIKKMRDEFKIQTESLKYFAQLIQNDKVNIPIECYKDIYTLSEYFRIPKFISELDKISEEELFKDLNFSIQILLDSERTNDELDTKLTINIEHFLVEHINECIENSKFRELPVSTIFRILELSEKGNVNSNSLFEFISESASTRFILLKFVELHKLTDEEIDEFIEFIEKQEEENGEKYLECMPVSLSFIKHMKNKYDELLKEHNKQALEIEEEKMKHIETKEELQQTKEELKETKEELKQTKEELEQTKEELKRTKEELKRTKEELEQTKEELEQTNEELEQTKEELEQTKEELKQTKEELKETKEELDKCKRELKQAEDEINRMKIENKKQAQAVLIGGQNVEFVLGEKPNNKNDDGRPVISPPVKSLLNPSSLLSFSSYSRHSVVVTCGGSLMGVGGNNGVKITSSLPKSIIDHFTEFNIKDESGHQLVPVSAVCGLNGTLYMFSKMSGSGRQLVLCDCQINGGNPVFLDIGNHEPVSLFGGRDYAASIGVEGEVIFINRFSLKNSPSSRIESVSLPGGEKASSVACCNDSIIVLSSNGRVFKSPVKKEEEENILIFSAVDELTGEEIVWVSGTNNHYLAVNKEGRVFGRGSNGYGQLGLGREIKSTATFTEISSLRGYEIRAAYAGNGYSLFQTREGKILACGSNSFSELLLSSGPGKNVYSPTETTITSGATFCIVGDCISAVFIGIDPPPNTPNRKIDQNQNK